MDEIRSLDLSRMTIAAPTSHLLSGLHAPARRASPDKEVLALLATELEAVKSSIAALKDREKEITEDIARRVTVTSSDVDVMIEVELPDGRQVLVHRGARYSWDTDLLDELSGIESGKTKLSPEAYDAVKFGATVSRKDFERLSVEARKELEPALTLKPGTLTIKINKKGA